MAKNLMKTLLTKSKHIIIPAFYFIASLFINNKILAFEGITECTGNFYNTVGTILSIILLIISFFLPNKSIMLNFWDRLNRNILERGLEILVCLVIKLFLSLFLGFTISSWISESLNIC